MSRRVISIISNITFAITILLGGYILISNFLARRSLAPGVCPIDNNRTLIYIAIGFAVVTFILSSFDIKKEKDKLEQEGAEEQSDAKIVDAEEEEE